VSDPLLLFSEELRRRRKAAGLTQDALADRADMDPAEIRRFEAAKRDPGVRVLARLAKALDTTPAELLRPIT
jgi:transcriptional regulator with XRE-family HTH domain